MTFKLVYILVLVALAKANTDLISTILSKCIEIHNLSEEQMLKIWNQKEFSTENSETMKLFVCVMTETEILKDGLVNFDKVTSLMPKFISYKFKVDLEISKEIAKKSNLEACFDLPKNSDINVFSLNVRNCILITNTITMTLKFTSILILVILAQADEDLFYSTYSKVVSRCIETYNLPKEEMLDLLKGTKLSADNSDLIKLFGCVLAEFEIIKNDTIDFDKVTTAIPGLISLLYNLDLEKSKDIAEKANYKVCYDKSRNGDVQLQVLNIRNCIVKLVETAME
ncbi:hypothetical protein FQR65_LT07869 [Abscondita terminalis]|nr:hypothetical protein FQR65_LT07869 [Abscondita terminalis]